MQPVHDVYASPTRSLALSRYMSKVYMWMTVGIMLTGFTAWYVSSDMELIQMILMNKFVFYSLLIGQIGLVIGLSAGINRINAMTATLLFLLYALLNGTTLSIIALVYTSESIQSAFFTSGAAFAGLSAFGYFTKKDLGPVGNFCAMGLFGLIGYSILAIFFPTMMDSTAGKVYGLVGILVFAGLTAYDTQKIKNMAPIGHQDEQLKKGAIMGALQLYLDFVNLFLFVLRMSGRRK